MKLGEKRADIGLFIKSNSPHTKAIFQFANTQPVPHPPLTHTKQAYDDPYYIIH